MQGVHGLPKSCVGVGHKFVLLGELHQRFLLPNSLVTVQQWQHFGRQDKEPAVDEGAIATGLFFEAFDMTILNIKCSKTARRVCGCQGSSLTVFSVEGDAGSNVVIAHAVAIGKAKSFFVFYVLTDSL